MNTPTAEAERPPTEAQSVPLPVTGCLLVCKQCEMIARTVTNEQYVTRIPGKASLGEHLRHCVEHFSLFFEGLQTGIIDYDARKRNIELETSPTTCIAIICNITTQLKSLDELAMTKQVNVRTLFVPNASPIEVASTLSRELAFLSSHSIHHIAIVKMIAHALGISLPDEYGLSHATIAHRMNSRPRA